jgi:hypothetical protein
LFPGNHRYYVSSSAGSDTNPGSPIAPFKTLGHAVRYVHDGDDLLLKRSDTFTGSFGNQHWSHVTLGAYGVGDRPLVLTDTTNQSCIVNFNSQNFRVVGLHLCALHRDPSRPDFKLVEGNFGIYLMNCNNALVEDCLIEFFDDNIAAQGHGNTGFRLRRSVLKNAYSAGQAFAEGIFLDSQQNVVIEDTVFDTNGWNPILQAENDRRQQQPPPSTQSSAPGTQHSAPTTQSPSLSTQHSALSTQSSAPSTQHSALSTPLPWISSLQPLPKQPFPGIANIFCHGIYDNIGNGAGPSIIRDCIFVNSASTGAQQRPGGTIDNCLFIHNGKATDAFTGADQGQITNCVVLGSKSAPNFAGGGGLTLLSRTGRLTNNLIIHGSAVQQGAALVLDLPQGQTPDLTSAQATIDHNVVYDWPADDLFIFHARPQVQITNNIFGKSPKSHIEAIDWGSNNYQFSANIYEQTTRPLMFKQKVMPFADFVKSAGETTTSQTPTLNFTDPTRTVESYAQILGLPPTLADFMTAADAQSRDHWDERLTAPVINDYFREGFALKQ